MTTIAKTFKEAENCEGNERSFDVEKVKPKLDVEGKKKKVRKEKHKIDEGLKNYVESYVYYSPEAFNE
ncbi:MAG: hypothetical protein ABEK59_09935 [Halobacteria archaeon]